MSYEAYRVRKRFGWGGWEFAPAGDCQCSQEANSPCQESGCAGQVGTGCKACPPEVCRCACNIPIERYGGDVWIVQAGHPRKDIMLANRFAVGDASLPPVEELLKQIEFQRLLQPPKITPSKSPKITRKASPAGIVRV